MKTPALIWAEADPGRVWHTLCGRYAIVAHVLPENPPRTVYQARKIDQAMARAYPTQATLGYLLGERPWLWSTENHVHSAEVECDVDAFAHAHVDQLNVPEDLPAVALARF